MILFCVSLGGVRDTRHVFQSEYTLYTFIRRLSSSGIFVHSWWLYEPRTIIMMNKVAVWMDYDP